MSTLCIGSIRVQATMLDYLAMIVSYDCKMSIKFAPALKHILVVV
jgi:hypothetical protein